MAALRTPDERFAALPGWSFVPQYTQRAGYRVHFIDEGPRDAAITVLCLHGNPSWGYLYRHMIPVFTGAGLRVVAPDLIGFGRSDKPEDEAAHSFDFHRNMLLALVEELDLRNVMLVVVLSRIQFSAACNPASAACIATFWSRILRAINSR